MSTIADLLNQFNTKKTQYLQDAFARNRTLRSLYKSIASSVLSYLANNIMTMNAEQKTIHKDISYFNNLITLSDKKPPIPTSTYAGPKATIAGKEVPEMPIFLFQVPVLEIETAAATALASITLIEIAKDSPAADPDFENAFAKYYRFEVLSVSHDGTMSLGVDASLASLAMEGTVNLSSSDTLTYDQRITLTRTIKDAQGNDLMTVNNFIFIGSVRTSMQTTAATPFSIDLPIVLMRFEAIAFASTYLPYFRGIRLMSSRCSGTARSEINVLGNIIIVRASGFAGSIICR